MEFICPLSSISKRERKTMSKDIEREKKKYLKNYNGHIKI